MGKEGNCYFCGEPYDNYGHNPQPLASGDQRVCDICNDIKVIPYRLAEMMKGRYPGKKDDK